MDSRWMRDPWQGTRARAIRAAVLIAGVLCLGGCLVEPVPLAPPPPYAAHVWVPGYWALAPTGHIWISGHWRFR